ncbi:MAG: GDP-mannose 4,6-dehydratase [Desulfovibrionaceae bacterium]|nr:GDP-mannose 4,6-dehydratase [Desulfovibrionaceae bacterium]MBF0512640.1 GDP-mannose 4,6-dehydratase [Desulfovibrionaceae bacterium]
MNLSGKKVLVTGAGGFIGAHVCEALLAAGAEVTAMIRYTSHGTAGNLQYLTPRTREALRIEAGAIEDAEFVAGLTAGQDVVIHLAALIGIPYSYVAPRSYLRVNIEGSLNVLEAARRHGVSRCLMTSTSEVYGTARYAPIDENHPLQGQSPYSASKIAADKLAESYHRSFGLPVVIVRPFNTYGPGQSARAVIPAIIGQALCCPEIRLGSLTPVRDLLYVKDTAAGFLKAAAADCPFGEPVNLGTGRAVSIGELARTILDLMGLDKPLVTDPCRVRPEASEVFELICDNAKALATLGWKPEHGLAEGLAQTIAFFTNQPRPDDPSRYRV